MNIFIVQKPLCIRESLISCSGPALEWSGVILEGAPTCDHQTEPTGAPHTQWNGKGKGNDLAPI